jgi:hypothetical protein
MTEYGQTPGSDAVLSRPQIERSRPALPAAGRRMEKNPKVLGGKLPMAADAGSAKGLVHFICAGLLINACKSAVAALISGPASFQRYPGCKHYHHNSAKQAEKQIGQGIRNAQIHIGAEYNIRRELKKLPDHGRDGSEPQRRDPLNGLWDRPDCLLRMGNRYQEKVGDGHSAARVSGHVQPGIAYESVKALGGNNIEDKDEQRRPRRSLKSIYQPGLHSEMFP